MTTPKDSWKGDYEFICKIVFGLCNPLIICLLCSCHAPRRPGTAGDDKPRSFSLNTFSALPIKSLRSRLFNFPSSFNFAYFLW